MNIQDAINEAKNKGRGISRTSWVKEGMLLIPTNTVYGFILVTDEGKMIPSWQPVLDDLIAEDWKVFG